jgi:hypothetical protein
MDVSYPLRHYDLKSLAHDSSKSIPELAGLDRADLASFLEVRVPCGSYRVWLTGEVAANHLWVFIPLDEGGRVKGHHFFTLEELAEHERTRFEARARGEPVDR